MLILHQLLMGGELIVIWLHWGDHGKLFRLVIYFDCFVNFFLNFFQIWFLTCPGVLPCIDLGKYGLIYHPKNVNCVYDNVLLAWLGNLVS